MVGVGVGWLGLGLVQRFKVGLHGAEGGALEAQSASRRFATRG